VHRFSGPGGSRACAPRPAGRSPEDGAVPALRRRVFRSFPSRRRTAGLPCLCPCPSHASFDGCGCAAGLPRNTFSAIGALPRNASRGAPSQRAYRAPTPIGVSTRGGVAPARANGGAVSATRCRKPCIERWRVFRRGGPRRVHVRRGPVQRPRVTGRCCAARGERGVGAIAGATREHDDSAPVLRLLGETYPLPVKPARRLPKRRR